MLLYVDGLLAQLIGNYARWKQGGGYPGGGTFPVFASLSPSVCLYEALRFPYGICGLLVIGVLVIVLLLIVWAGRGNRGEYDKDRNFTYSVNGTYGTSGWMGRKEMEGVLETVTSLRHYKGIVLGMLGKRFVCVPEKTRLNSNLAVYGASGSMKTRSFCMNRILQGVSRGESLVICDPKSELYEKSNEYLRDKGYTVRGFNLVNPENSDSWNCLSEVEGQELMAQLFVDVIIRNKTGCLLIDTKRFGMISSLIRRDMFGK